MAELAMFAIASSLPACSGTSDPPGSGAGAQTAQTQEALNLPGWSTPMPMPTPTYYPGAAVVQGVLYSVGGCVSGDCGRIEDVSDVVQAYDAGTNTWSFKASMPTKRGWLSAAAIGGKIYAVGGEGVPGIPLRTVEVYDTSLGSWSAAPPLNQARVAPAVGAINGKLYVAGGSSQVNVEGNALDTVEVFDPAEAQLGWQTITAPGAIMHKARGWSGAAAAGGKLYVIGGFDNVHAMVTDVEAYDPVSQTWTQLAPVPRPQGVAVPATVADGDGQIYLVGGLLDPNHCGVQDFRRYDPSMDLWSSGQLLPTGRCGTASGIANDTIFVAGGFTVSNAGPVTVNEAYAPLHACSLTVP